MALLSLLLMMKDESGSVESVIESAAPAVDLVVLLDTGSLDDTIDLAEQACARVGKPLVVYREEFVDFATTRNRALELACPYSMFALQLSGDETLENPMAVRSFCEQVEHDPVNMIFVPLQTGVELMLATRLVRLGSGWRWKGAIHEFMEHISDEAALECVQGAKIVHRESDPARKQKRFYQDLQTLRACLAEDPKDPRTVFYMAQTLAGLGLYAEALEYYKRRMTLGGWEEERYISGVRAGVCAQTLSRPWDEVQGLFLRATAIRPSRAEALALMAAICFERSEMGLAYLYASAASRIPYPKLDALGIQPAVYEHQALNLVHLSALYVGELDAGLAATEEIIRRQPDVHEYKTNLIQYQEAITHQRLALDRLQRERIRSPQ